MPKAKPKTKSSSSNSEEENLSKLLQLLKKGKIPKPKKLTRGVKNKQCGIVWKE